MRIDETDLIKIVGDRVISVQIYGHNYPQKLDEVEMMGKLEDQGPPGHFQIVSGDEKTFTSPFNIGNIKTVMELEDELRLVLDSTVTVERI